jgi:UDP-glucose 4-epimerase
MIFMARGTGYFGTHTCVELPNNGMDVTVFDNFCNSHPPALARVE